MHHDKFGIYINVKDGTVMRISSPYWIPSGDEWVFLTEEVNTTLLKIRDLAEAKKLVDDPQRIDWGDWSKVPLRD